MDESFDCGWGLRAQTVHQKLKQNAQTLEAGGRQVFFSVLYTTHLKAISLRQYYNTINKGVRAPILLRFRWGFGQTTCSTLKQKLFDISRRLHPVKFFQ